MCAVVSEVAASDILVGRTATHRVLGSCAILEQVDTATATRVGLQFPFHPERRGRGAPGVAMKWRDAVKAAIMHGCHSRCAVLVATWNATATTGGQHGASAAGAQTRRSAEQLSERTCASPTRRSCGSWTSTPIKRVSMASHSLTTFARRSIWCWSSSAPWHPTHSADGMTAAHVTSAADRPWNCHHSPCAAAWTTLSAPARVLLSDAQDHARGPLGHDRRD